jgi:S-DNA-T family DNA segregation ATPase FtsK/SpoIIIE
VRLTLVYGEPVRLGRHETGAVGEGIGQHKNVSRLHAQLELKPDGVVITDLGSTNGTFVDGLRIEPGMETAVLVGAPLRLAADCLIRIEN